MTLVAEPAVALLVGCGPTPSSRMSAGSRRDLRSGSPTAATRYAEVRAVSTDRLCHQSGWSGMRLQVVERATATLLVGENSSKPLES